MAIIWSSTVKMQLGVTYNVHTSKNDQSLRNICSDNVTHIKISNKLTPSINYFYSNRTYTVNLRNNLWKG